MKLKTIHEYRKVMLENSGLFRPLLASALVVAIFWWYHANLVSTKIFESDKQVLIKYLDGRILFAATASTLTILLLVNLLVYSYAIRKEAGESKFIAFAVFSVGLILVYLVVMLDCKLSENRYFGQLAELAMQHIQPSDNSIVHVILTFNDSLGIAVVFGALFTAITLMQRTDNNAHVRRKLKLFKWALYSGTLLLAVGLLEIHALYRWGALASGGEELISGVKSIVVSAGFLFSLLLFAYWLPVAMRLEHTIQDMKPTVPVKDPNDKSEVQEKLFAELEITALPTEQLGNYIAIFSPIFLGLTTTLLAK